MGRFVVVVTKLAGSIETVPSGFAPVGMLDHTVATRTIIIAMSNRMRMGDLL